MKIVQKPVIDLEFYEFNNKDHPRSQIDLLIKSIEKYGFNVPVVINKDNIIIAGHGRVMAAKRIGMETVPCIVKDDLTDEQVRAYRLLDNKIAEQSITNVENIKVELQEIGDIELQQIFYDIDLSEVEVGDANTPEQNWVGMPEYHQDDLTPFRQIIVSFQSQADVDKFAKLVGQNITDKTKSFWYPFVANTPMMDKVYVSKKPK